jgi:hypothetical protein
MKSSRCQLCVSGALALILLLSGCSLSAPAPTAAPVPDTLNVTVWPEWPVMRAGMQQRVHVIVADTDGKRKSSATVLGKWTRPSGENAALVFPLTDADGYTFVLLPEHAPVSAAALQRVDVQATLLANIGRSWTQYELQP